jgi:group I intron endonuclease
MYVYLITNTVTGKRYVGKTERTVEWRWTCHVRAINRSHRPLISSAIAKYGAENFKIETLSACTNPRTLCDVERFWIRHLSTKVPNGYNLTDGGDGAGGYARRHSLETREKIRKSLTGRKLPLEVRLKISQAGYNRKPPSEETRAKLRKASTGNRNFLGRSHSLETREKMRLAAEGRKHTEESLTKMRRRIFSAETRQKMSLAWDRRKARNAVKGIR